MGKPRKHLKHLPQRMRFKNGAYYHVYYVDKKQLWHRLSRDYSEALRLWAEREGDEQREGTTVNHMIDRYLIEILPTLAIKTQSERNRQAVRLKSVYGSMRLGDVRPQHIARYLDQRMAKVSANREITFLSSMYQYAMRWGWCILNPCTGIRRNTEKKRTRYITDKELQTLIDVADRPIAVIIEVAYLTGLRKSDLLNIRLNDIKPEGLFVTPQKTQDSNGSMVFSHSPKLQSALAHAKLLRKGSIGHLFTTRHGKQRTISGFNSSWRRLKEKTGITDIHFHDIRAKTLTDAKRLKGIEYAQDLGNHNSVETTESYVKSFEIKRVDPLG
ncbi:MAG: tyrosine-type recombinase/integrase [Gammaproteobacteria bacterium]